MKKLKIVQLHLNYPTFQHPHEHQHHHQHWSQPSQSLENLPCNSQSPYQLRQTTSLTSSIYTLKFITQRKPTPINVVPLPYPKDERELLPTLPFSDLSIPYSALRFTTNNRMLCPSSPHNLYFAAP